MSMATGSNGQALARVEPGQIQREGFGTEEIEVAAETASVVLAAQAKAEVEAAYVVALRKPRDLDDCRAELMKSAARPFFAASAIYVVPRGGKDIEGLTVRFAEEALRCYKNARSTRTVIYDDADKRIVRIRILDLESNIPYEQDFIVEKTMERSRVKEGETILARRINSYGREVFVVPATESELLVKESAQASKVRRTLILQMVPSWIVEEAKEAVYRTREAIREETAKDPDAARRQLLDTFTRRGVRPSDLKEYLGHDPAGCSPTEFDELRGLLTAIQEGEITWPDALAAKLGTRAPEAPGEQKAEATATVEKLRARGAAAKEAAKKAAEKPATPPAATEEPRGRARPVRGTRQTYVEGLDPDDPAASDPAMAEGVDVGEPGENG
jgi:hypothetical protein